MSLRQDLGWFPAAFAVIWIPLASGQSPAPAGTEVIISRDFVHQPLPKWENGFLVGFGLEPPSAPPVYAYDRAGDRLFEAPLAIAGASRVRLRSMAASRDGRFAFSGLAENQPGTAAPFIAFLDRAGRITRLIRPEGGSARHLCFAPDGTLWAAMSLLGARRDEPAPEHDLLRAYSPGGELKLSLLPRSTFAAFSEGEDGHPHPALDSRFMPSQLAAGESGIAFISPGYKQLVRLSPDGKLISRTPIERPAPQALITGFALGPDGEVYLSTQAPAGENGTDFGFYRWDEGAGAWARVYSRPSGETGRPTAVAMIERNAMLVTIAEGRYRWAAREGATYRLAEP
jgi:hypothetical protein